MSAVALHLGDCLEGMRRLPPGSVGHVVTDPPYGQSNESYDRGVDPLVWHECYRVTGPNAALISFAGSPTYHRIASDIEAAGWKVRQMWGWVYRDGMITSAFPKEGFDRLAPAMDPIVFATKGKVLLRLEREGGAWSMKSRSRRGPMSDRFRSPERLCASGRHPKSLVSDGAEPFEYFAASRQPRGEGRTGHPNQKPLALMRWLVGKLPTVAGVICDECKGKGRPGWPECVVATICPDCRGKGRWDVPYGPILDPFAGSGTTLEAARLEGHDAIGFEADPAYHALGLRRLDESRAATPLFA